MELETRLDQETPRRERSGYRVVDESALYPRKKSLVLKAAGALLVIVLLFVFFGAAKNKDATKELEAVKSKLNGLEQRLARIEAVEQKGFASESRIGELQSSVNSLQVLTRSMKEQMEKPAKTAPTTLEARSATPQKAPSERRFHVVSRGETVFSISKKYGLSSYELGRLNHLSKNLIQPGQRLVIDTGI